MSEPSLEVPLPEKKPEEHLDSWKEIAAYLNRDVTTVQRWEKREGMPVHRHLHDKRGSVYAIGTELDAWLGSRKKEIDSSPTAEAIAPQVQPVELPTSTSRSTWFRIGTGVVAIVGIIVAALVFRSHQNGMERRVEVSSIAVLPLRNLTGDPSQDYLAEGLTEALIDRLSSIRNLRVVSHTSVMRFRNPQVSTPEIAKSLGVDAIVEGSVVRDGSRIRVTAQLIRGATDEHFWSQTYDREMRDVLTLESEVAQSIAAKVQVTLTGQEQQRLVAAHSVTPEVYESYLKGLFALEKDDRADYGIAIKYFEEAVRRDPGFAPAYLGLAAANGGLSTVYIGTPPQEARQKEMKAVRKALELDPNLGEAHVLLAEALQNEWHWAEAEAEFRRTLELNPNSANAHAGLAGWLLCQGRTDEALQWINRARELDPMTVPGSQVAWMLFQSHRYDEAVHELRSSLALQPEDSGTMWFLGFVLIAKDQPREAIPVLEKAADVSKRSSGVLGVLVRAYAHAGRRKDAQRVLLELKKRQSNGYVPAAAFVNAYLGLGDTEQAFVWLEKAYDEKSNILEFVKTQEGVRREVEYPGVRQNSSLLRPDPGRSSVQGSCSSSGPWLMPGLMSADVPTSFAFFNHRAAEAPSRYEGCKGQEHHDRDSRPLLHPSDTDPYRAH